MTIKRLCVCLWLMLVLGLTTCQVMSQDLEYNSLEELMSDINNRRLGKPILFMCNQISAIEEGKKPFDDGEYIGYATLLTTCFVQNDQPYKADSILSHAIYYMHRTGRTSQYKYALHTSYGGLLMSLENYNRAAIQLKTAIEEMQSLGLVEANYAIVMSMLAVCHMNTNQIDLAEREIEDAISIIEEPEKENNVTKQTSIYHDSNLMGIYQKAGAIYYEKGDTERAIRYTQKAYELSKYDETNVSVYLYTALNLATMKLNEGNYNGTLSLLHEIEDKPMYDSERIKVYLDIFQAYYHLEKEDKCVEYAQLCSNCIINNSRNYYTSFPGTTIEDIWNSSASQLKVNMGILDKFPHNTQAAIMSYDNALFIKRLLYDRMVYLRRIAKTNGTIGTTIRDINRFRAELLGGDTTVYESLNLKEKSLIEQLNSMNYSFSNHLYNWQEISEALGENEYAIEVISYVGIPKNEKDEKQLRIGALILTHDAIAPKFVDVCANDSLYKLVLNAYSQREIGINNLYTKDGEFALYNLVWSPIESFVKSAKRIYFSPTLLLQNINIGFILCPDGTMLQDKYDIHIVSSTATVCDKTDNVCCNDAILYGGIYYYSKEECGAKTTSIRGMLNDLMNNDNRGTFGYLSASSREVDEINNLLVQHKYTINLMKGILANELSFRKLDGASPKILHLSTHGFYLVGLDKFANYFERLIPCSQSNSDMIKSGLLLADANTSLKSNKNPVIADGVLTAEEISWMDLSNTQLVVLSACETAIGQSFQEGFGGLIRAFKMAGVKHVIASLWKVSDEATADLMILFYKNLTAGMNPHESLIKAQREMSLRYPDPYYWAAFIMID